MGGGKKTSQIKLRLSRLHSFDVFLEDGNTSENDVSLTLWQHDDTTQAALVVISTNLSVCVANNKLISGKN